MSRRCAGLVLAIAVVAAQCAREEGAPAPAAGADVSDVAASRDIRAVLDRYVQAVNDGNGEALRDLWADLDDVSFVNPVQRLRSWDELQGFWQEAIQKGFTRRDLTLENVEIRVAGDGAWAVYDWEFDGTLADGKPYHATGWETQVYRRTDRGWRISHVHYSVPAAPPPSGQ